MNLSDNVLDFGEIQDSNYKPNIVEYTVEGITRLGHYIIDHIARTIVFTCFAFFFEFIGSSVPNLIFLAYLPFFLYYPVMEFYFGKTIGKMITKSTVVNIDGGKITIGQAIGRSLCRFIPFNIFSFLGVSAIGWHDSLSKTRVVKDSFFKNGNDYF